MSYSLIQWNKTPLVLHGNYNSALWAAPKFVEDFTWMICRSVWAGPLMHMTVGSKSINQSNKQRWPQPGGIQTSQSIIIVLSAVPSIQSTQHRPVCRDIYPSFLQGAITLQSPDLGYMKWNTTLPTSLFLYLSYSKLPVIESCSPGRTARQAAVLWTHSDLVTVVKNKA